MEATRKRKNKERKNRDCKNEKYIILKIEIINAIQQLSTERQFTDVVSVSLNLTL